jgi:integrase
MPLEQPRLLATEESALVAKPETRENPMNLKTRNGKWYVRKLHDGKQQEASLQTASKVVATTRANRFLTTLEETGSWQVAVTELRGKEIIKKGESPTMEQFKELYKQFVSQSPKPIRPNTFATNISALKRLMETLKVKTVSEINTDRIKFTPENRKTIISEIKHSKAMFKPACLRFYNKQGVKVSNPFTQIELGGMVRNPYTPLSSEKRKAIWDEARKLPPDESLCILIALGAGLRKNEIDKARVSWISFMDDHAIFTVKSEDDFIPKSSANRNIPISKDLAEEILAIRETMNPNENDPYILAGDGRGATRKDKTFRRISTWLKSKGVTFTNPLHSLRKEFGSNVFTAHGVGVASVLLGHADIKLTMDTYAGLTASPVIDIGGMINGKLDPLEALAKSQGISLEALKDFLAKQKQAS